jgi:hypothetical protein
MGLTATLRVNSDTTVTIESTPIITTLTLSRAVANSNLTLIKEEMNHYEVIS